MNRDKLTQITELIFLGPFFVAAAIAAVCVVAALLMFLVPTLVSAIIGFVVFALFFVLDLLIRPSLVKLWAVFCFLGATLLVYKWYSQRPGPSLPEPRVRRGRQVEPEQQVRERARDAIERRRQALRRHSIS